MPKRPAILLVDDEPNVLSALRRLLHSAPYQILTANSGAAALEVLVAHEVDLIISDMRMPGMSGAELLSRAQALYPDCMRILLTGYSEIDAVARAVNEGGIYRYLNKPWDEHDLLLTIRQALEQRRLRSETARLLLLTQQQNDQLAAFNAELEAKVKSRTEEIRQTVMFLEDAQRDLKRGFMTMVQVGASMIELRCGAIGGESHRVGQLAKHLALALGLDGLDAQDLYFAGLLHGIGKLSLPDEILHKSIDRMTPAEANTYYRHPLRAQMLLTPVAQLNPVAHIIRHQYERFNGRGIPDGLAEGNIPLGSRILAVARDFEGLQSGAITRERLLAEQAAELIKMQSGLRYDPQVVEQFLELLKDPSLLGGSTPFQQVASGQLKSGMRLADDLRTGRGVLLMTKGSVVSDYQVSVVRRYEAQEETPFTILIETSDAHPVTRQDAA
ncbi:HD domain-containing phosphohydrolase [Dyella flagellata]|uniref:Two-component system response regulator n=1 Tax=Dyella flagellata TaxID=1867833 RepID=A0ABQ5X9F4_9GAMM|nr:HD domain-containing phosphohydrolase [Dyella flagellata]GLQ87879.1 two-component system response regulator [Dyella flagellata]